MALTSLISTSELALRLGDEGLALIDCRFDLADVAAGRRLYEAAHIPGAVYAHVNDDLAGPPTGTNGRHPLPDPDAFTATLGRLGIANDTQVIAYDQDTGMYASRLWWMLRWLGHDSVAVLDGGYAKWSAEARPTTPGVERKAARVFRGVPQAAMVASIAEVSAGSPLLDARAPERYRGDVEPIDRVPGHIPGARNHFYKDNLTEDGVFRTPAELRTMFEQSLGDIQAERLVCYCGSGVTACHNLLALEHAGLHGARLYPGSWSEWSSDPGRPVERSTK
jgi:thiosulfate/3-mercaptopyruvate sulfurtransferase